MTKNLDSTGSANALFACGHENSYGNSYCDACGTARNGRKCPACDSPNREDAKFCGACGVHLQDEGSSPRETIVAAAARSSAHPAVPPIRLATDPNADQPLMSRFSDVFGTKNLAEKPRSGRGSWRRDDRSLFSVEEDPLEDDILAEDYAPAGRRRYRPFVLTVAAVIVAGAAVVIGLGVGRFGATWYGGTFGVSGPPASPGSPRVIDEQPPPDSTRATPSVSSTESATVPTGTVTTTASVSETARAPVPADEAQGFPPNPLRPGRTSPERPAGTRGRASSGPTPASAPSPGTSEERMAEFLVEQLGPAGAAEKALLNATWYNASQSEHAYWQQVADTIRRRAER